jgi:hypothetical protein
LAEQHNEFAEFKESTFNETKMVELNSSSKLQELMKLESKQIDFDIK